jgi:uracil-DNA glycosylase
MGFFSSKQVQSTSMVDGRIQSCTSCGLYKGANTPRMEPFGNFKKGILNIGTAPGTTDDMKGKRWQGKTGRMLAASYRRFNIDLFEDCLNIDAVNCKPTTDGAIRDPSDYEINCCRRRVIQVIEQYKPKVIVLLGKQALVSVIGHVWRKNMGGIIKWRGLTIPDRTFGTWICPIFHPREVVQKGDFAEVKTIWEQDIKRAVSKLDIALPESVDESKQVHIITDHTDFKNELSKLTANTSSSGSNVIAFDIETTGLKPHNVDKHRIICISLCGANDRSIVFKTPTHRSGLRVLRKVLQSDVGLVAHNMKFEDTWVNVILGYPIKAWAWDSMQASHLIDNRRGITGLKFQTYIHFGVSDYSSHLDKYLRAVDEKNGNSVNRIEELIKTEQGYSDVLIYCGLDTLYTRRLALIQMEQLGFGQEGVL